ncbi:MAG: type IV pilus twitching motility protein PilT [Bdellovibrionaceae bacterium]|nr:type IV pilus twitching motility protein PilT [Pseudobdellovibrionaceae bacterium]
MKLDEILALAIKKDASDVHLKAGLVPVIRKHGKLRPLQNGLPQLTNQEIEEMAFAMMDEEQRSHYAAHKDIDLGYGVTGLGRFRVNVFRQRGSTRMVIRNIPFQIPTIEDLKLPSIVSRIADIERGLILVTGVTGSGKSSTLASMIDHINSTKNKHILTIEDPIEFLIRDRKSIISQRELGVDTRSFAGALRAALRQDPDVILIGEMRDRETIEIAMVAAETGHLVLSTLHTIDSQESINRILSAFEPHQQDQIRLQLASVLKGVISQRLARRKDKMGFVPAVEVLICNQRVREMIEDPQKTKDLNAVVEESKETMGMQSFDQSLMDLLTADLIDFNEAMRLASNPEDFQLRYSGVSSGDQQWSDNSRLKSRLKDEWDKVGGLEIDGSEEEDE